LYPGSPILAKPVAVSELIVFYCHAPAALELATIRHDSLEINELFIDSNSGARQKTRRNDVVYMSVNTGQYYSFFILITI